MSVWASPSVTTGRNTRSLLDIMSEELAVKLQSPEESVAFTVDNIDQAPGIEQIEFEEITDEDSDLALALALQELENSSYYESARSQSSFNKIAVSSSGSHQFPSLPGGAIIHSSDRYAAEVLGQMMCGEEGEGVQFRDGVAVLRDGTIVSKHDPLLDGLANGIALTELDGVGDLDFAGLMVGNTVANDLRMFRQKKQKKGIATNGRVSAKDISITTETVFDPATRLIIFKLIQSGRIDNLYGVIKAGKEANVYQAEREVPVPQPHGDPRETWGNLSQFAVKVFKTTLNEFSTRADYVDGDQRYGGKKFSKLPKRNAISQWTEKEYRNLCRAYSAGLAVPQPLYFKNNVLVMALIGDPATTSRPSDPEHAVNDTSQQTSLQYEPSPQLKEAAKSVGDLSLWRDIYLQTLETVYNLYHKCRLVHADLSEYNILLRGARQVYLIDFGQSVDISHPEHLVYLRRDLETITTFFGKYIEHIISVNTIMSIIVGDVSAKLPVRQKGKGMNAHANSGYSNFIHEQQAEVIEDFSADSRVLFEQAMCTL